MRCRVYACLSTGLMAIALGVYVDDKFRVAGTMTQVLLFAMVFGLTMIKDVYNRLAIFHATGLLMGINIGTLVNSVMYHRWHRPHPRWKSPSRIGHILVQGAQTAFIG